MRKLFDRLIKFISELPIPLTLILVCTLAYGLLIPWLGFFMDDWYIIFTQKFFGSTDFSLFFQGDRPLFAYVYMVFAPLFKDSILGWQLFALFSHILTAICYWWLLVLLLPGRRKLAAIAALFFAVYPGFQFHWFSVQYSQVFLLLAVYILSFILMIEGVRKERGRSILIMASIGCMIIGIVPQENFFGLELIRPILLMILFSNLINTKVKWLKKVFVYYLPYLIIFLGFVIIRVGFSDQYSYPIKLLSEIQVSPLSTLLNLAGEGFWTTIDSTFTAWTNTFELLKRDMLSISSALMMLIILIGFVLSYLVLKDRNGEEQPIDPNLWIMIIGFLATAAAMIPYFAGSFKMTLDYPNNRYLLALAPGASLFLAGFIDWLLRTDKQKMFISSLLIGFAIGSQFMVARSFMLLWNQQQDFFWQLTWRVPALKPNTLLITDNLPFSKYFSGASLTAPLNMIYDTDIDSHHIPYLMLLYSQNKVAIQDFSPDQFIVSSVRSFDFYGNTSLMLVFIKPPDGCLRILTPSDSKEITTGAQNSSFMESAIPLSNPNQIIASVSAPAIPPRKYFGVENPDQWCYFFEKADLSRQLQDWDQTIMYYKAAQTSGFKPLLDVEWMPLVDAYLHLNDPEQALEITKSIDHLDKANTIPFCNLWKMMSSSATDQHFYDEAKTFLDCN